MWCLLLSISCSGAEPLGTVCTHPKGQSFAAVGTPVAKASGTLSSRPHQGSDLATSGSDRCSTCWPQVLCSSYVLREKRIELKANQYVKIHHWL